VEEEYAAALEKAREKSEKIGEAGCGAPRESFVQTQTVQQHRM
jgi:hypothetical protein